LFNWPIGNSVCTRSDTVVIIERRPKAGKEGARPRGLNEQLISFFRNLGDFRTQSSMLIMAESSYLGQGREDHFNCEDFRNRSITFTPG
jgi:hypothetical protein